MEDGRHPSPRPPRRIPANADSITQLQSSPPSSPRPSRQPWVYGRFLVGFLVLLLVVAGGGAAGWWIRSQSLRIDSTQLLQSTGPAVVRVLATTCEGTGEASGVLTENGLVLTATSAVRQPLSIVIVTSDNQIRRANLLGSGVDGVAVLRMIGQLDDQPLPLAVSDPDPKAERALIGYTAAGKLASRAVGSSEKPVALGEVMNAAKLGGPVVNKAGEVVGLVVGDTVQASTIVGVGKLREYVAPGSNGITPEPGGSCTNSRGPQAGIAPEMQVASTALAAEAQHVLANYLTLENKRDFDAVRALYSRRLAKTLSIARDRQIHETSYFFGAKLTEVSRYGVDGAYARMTYNVLFSPNAKGADGDTCNRLDVRYRLVREGGKLVIDQTSGMIDPQSCDSE